MNVFGVTSKLAAFRRRTLAWTGIMPRVYPVQRASTKTRDYF